MYCSSVNNPFIWVMVIYVSPDVFDMVLIIKKCSKQEEEIVNGVTK